MRRHIPALLLLAACELAPTATAGQPFDAPALARAATASATLAAPDTVCSGGPKGTVSPQVCATLPDTIPLGGRVTVWTGAYDAIGRVVPKPHGRVFLSCLNTDTVHAANDRLTARALGVTACSAVWDRSDYGRLVATRVVTVRDTLPATVPDSTPADSVVVPPPDSTPGDTVTVPDTVVTPPPGSDVPRKRGRPDLKLRVSVTRWDGTTRGAVVTGIPLPPGYLIAADTEHVRLRLNGAPQRIHVTALPALHPDGTLRAVLVAGVLPVDVGELVVTDTVRPNAEQLAASEVPAPVGVPAGALLPSDPAYLVTTLLVGPTRTVAETRALGGVWPRYEDDFIHYGDRIWGIEGDQRSANYYDRALMWFAWWARTGNAEYWHRGVRQAHRYRVDYLEYNNYSSSPHNSHLEGQQLHYLLTGDTLSRVAVGRVADMLYRSVQLRGGHGDTATDQSENRQHARALQAALMAERLGWTVNKLAAETPRAAMAAMVDDLLRMQRPGGDWHFNSLCGGDLVYMSSMVAEQFIEYDRLIGDARILPALERHAEWMWSTQWRPGESFNYATVACTGVGGPNEARDVLGLQVNEFAWLWAKTGDPKWRDRANAILVAMVGKVWLDGTKQLTQTYVVSHRSLYYLTAR